MDDKLLQIKQQATDVIEEIIKEAAMRPGQILVLGASSSEILGKHIGRATSPDVGRVVIEAALAATRATDIFLAVQCCEHLNRALVVEVACAEAYLYDTVSARPVPQAGGAVATAAYDAMQNPALIEHIDAHAGVDFGDTNIGMHVKFVQVPFRPTTKKVGDAHVTALRSRPRLIGGERAQYTT